MVVGSCGGRVHRGFLPGDPKEGNSIWREKRAHEFEKDR